MVIATAILLASSPSWIDGARLERLSPIEYRLTLSASKAKPYVKRFVSNDPPTPIQVNDVRQGPAVLVQGFDPQADFLFVVSHPGKRWVASETIDARYGIFVRHGRAGNFEIESRPRNDAWPFEKGEPEWIAEHYVLSRGALLRRGARR